VEPESDCVNLVRGALTSGSLKTATNTVTMVYITTAGATVRLGVQDAAVKVRTVTFIAVVKILFKEIFAPVVMSSSALSKQ